MAERQSEIVIEKASVNQAPVIASLIMEAMDYDCCQNLAGPDHTLEDFHILMTRLVEEDNSQYSYKNAIVAMTGGEVAGVLVGYDGKDLSELRKAFINGACSMLGQDFSNIADETNENEFYIDSLCVKKEFRGQGIATKLLKHTLKLHKNEPVGLLVDFTHPDAERLYLSLGFKFINETSWAGHKMKHLQWSTK